ncbi:MAG: hypothetical protein JXQ75_04630 [Phycisphaerae bacterium]|nr:hypothetical protein [Phycisphaerae bacterium]
MKQPVAKYRAGQVSCALWENEAKIEGRVVTMLKATVERRYVDSSGNWKSSGSLSRNEVALAIWCLQRAFDYMIEKQPEEGQVEEETVR